MMVISVETFLDYIGFVDFELVVKMQYSLPSPCAKPSSTKKDLDDSLRFKLRFLNS